MGELTLVRIIGRKRKDARGRCRSPRHTMEGKLIAEIWVQCKRVSLPRSHPLPDDSSVMKRKKKTKYVEPGRGLRLVQKKDEKKRKNVEVPMTSPRRHKSAISSRTLSPDARGTERGRNLARIPAHENTPTRVFTQSSGTRM